MALVACAGALGWAAARAGGEDDAAAAATNGPSIERGRYIAEAVADCTGCHTRHNPHDFAEMTGPHWAGGEEFGPEWGLPGSFVTPNVTPDPETGIGLWTPAEIKRAIRHGINREGERLFPLMPYYMYRYMSERDLDSLVMYLRSLPPHPHPSRRVSDLKIPRSAIPPQPPLQEPVPEPPTDPVGYGEYLLLIANCMTCHSPTKGGQPVPGRLLAGGVRITGPFGTISTPNITPDMKTGIGAYTEEDFIRLMKEGVKRGGAPLFLNYMPWYAYRHMTVEDLKAMYAYLRSLPPVENEVGRAENQFPLGG